MPLPSPLSSRPSDLRSRARRASIPLAAGGILAASACAGPSDLAGEQVDFIQQSLSVCDEVVPPTRFIDGFPAYAQCDAFADSAIFSNNGIDTSATKLGADWVRTQYSGGYQCTELATRYFHFKWGVDYVPRGNAGAWCDSEPPANSGVVKTTTPVHGDMMVLAPGSCGAAQSTGHVNLVDTVDMAGGKLVAVEQNMARRGSYKISCGKCFLHAVVNDGSAAADAGASTPQVDAGGSKADASALPAAPPDAGRRDAGKTEPTPPDDEDESETANARPDAGRARDAGRVESPDEDDEQTSDDDDTALPAAAAAEAGCAVSGSAQPQLTAFGLLLLTSFGLLQRRRKRVTVRR